MGTKLKPIGRRARAGSGVARGRSVARAPREDATGETLDVSVARERFADSLNRVCYRKDRVVIVRRGRPVAALVSMEDLELIRKLEDRVDLTAARRALRGRDGRTLAEVRASLGV